MSAPIELELPHVGDYVAAKYRVEEVLGRGGMGAVFRVTHAVTGKSFAVKWLLPQYHAGQEVAQRFIREAQVAGRVDHPNIVEVYDIGEDRGSMYMVMELLQGESLAQHLARVGRVQANQACQLMISVARGLAAAHRSGVIHRDLKPDNIFLSVSTLGEPRPKILDFGISKMSALASDVNPALTREGVVMGTPNYMAPEQLRSHRVDERCDVYALGVILYQMLSGTLPFVGDNFPDLMLKIISDTPIPLAKLAPETPRELIRIVECAMARSPAERFDSVADLGRALEPFGQGALFDVEQKLSTRPPSSILPGPATPVATESRFPDVQTQPIDLLQRARRLSLPLAVSALSAALFSWIYVSIDGQHGTSPAAALASPIVHAAVPPPAAEAPELQDTLPVPEVTELAEPQKLTAAAAPDALIGQPAQPDPEPIAQLDAEPAAQLDAEPVAQLDAEPIAQLDAEPIAQRNAEPIAQRNAEPAAQLDAEPVAQLNAAAAAEPRNTQPAKLPAGVIAPAPVPPPGAAASASAPAKPGKAAKKAAPKAYASPEIRMNDFFQ